jgi:hypothetical protein
MRRLRLTVLAVVLVWPAAAGADRRSFTRTFEYMTMARGETEVAIYTTQSQATFDGDSPETFELQLEIAHGITDRWDVSLHHVFDQTTGNGTTADPGQPLHFSEMKLRSRYRFSERGELPVDAAAYLEAAKVFGGSVYEAEARAIVARDVGMVSVAVNPIVALVFGGDVPEPELALGWAAGVSFEARPTLEVGAETWGWFEAEAIDEAAASAGPSLSWAPSTSFWIAATVGFGLNDNADRFNLRGLIGMHI